MTEPTPRTAQATEQIERRAGAYVDWLYTSTQQQRTTPAAFDAGWDAATRQTATPPPAANDSRPGTWVTVADALSWPELIQRTRDAEWTWDSCIHCGSSAITTRGLVLEDGPAGSLRRIAWCDLPSCDSDRTMTDYLVTPRAGHPS